MSANLVAGPYTGNTEPSGITISWITDTNESGEVRYSEDQSYASVQSAETDVVDEVYQHTTCLSGLNSATVYYYKIYSGGVDITPWSTVTFQTMPDPGTTQYTFLAVGDSRPQSSGGQPSSGARSIAARMAQETPLFVLYSGDSVYRGGTCTGSNSSWKQYFRAYFDLYKDTMKQAPIYSAIGNHELSGGSCGYQAYTELFNLPENAPDGNIEKYYSFDCATVHIICLDTNQSYAPGSTQYNWLETDLQNNTKAWTVALFHHPAYSSGGHGSTASVQNYLVPLFEDYGVDVVFNGHDHDYERTCPIKNNTCTDIASGGIVYYVTGGGGAPLYTASGDWFTAHAESTYHYMKITVDDCIMQIDAINSNGAVFDSFRIDHCADPTPTPPGSTPTPPPSTATPTPVPPCTASPTATPPATCESLGVTLWMPATFYHPGDPCECRVEICNPEAYTWPSTPLFVVLDVWGNYYFAPSFSSTTLDHYTVDVPPGVTEVSVIEAFSWPENAGSADGVFWYAAMTNKEMTELFGEMGEWSFGWTDQ